MRELNGKITPLSEIDVERSIDQIIDVANRGLGHPAKPHRFVYVDISLLIGLYHAYKEAAQQSVQSDLLLPCGHEAVSSYMYMLGVCSVCDLASR